MEVFSMSILPSRDLFRARDWDIDVELIEELSSSDPAPIPPPDPGFEEDDLFEPPFPETYQRYVRPKATDPTPYLHDGVWYTDSPVPMLDWDFGKYTAPSWGRGEHHWSRPYKEVNMTPEFFWDEIVWRLQHHYSEMFHGGYKRWWCPGWRIYSTPNGYRALCLSSSVEWDTWDWIAQYTYCDPHYIRVCRERKTWACRLSPKEGRTEDWVAEYVCTLPCPDQDYGRSYGDRKELILMHDKWCRATRNAPHPKPWEGRTTVELLHRAYWEEMEEVAPVLLDAYEEEGLPIPNLVLEGDFEDSGPPVPEGSKDNGVRWPDEIPF